MRLDLAGVAVVFNGCARNTRSDVSTYFFRAASDRPATARDLVGRGSCGLTHWRWFRVANLTYGKYSRSAGLVGGRTVHSDVGIGAGRLERDGQAVRDFVHLVVVC